MSGEKRATMRGFFKKQKARKTSDDTTSGEMSPTTEPGPVQNDTVLPCEQGQDKSEDKAQEKQEEHVCKFTGFSEEGSGRQYVIEGPFSTEGSDNPISIIAGGKVEASNLKLTLDGVEDTCATHQDLAERWKADAVEDEKQGVKKSVDSYQASLIYSASHYQKKGENETEAKNNMKRVFAHRKPIEKYEEFRVNAYCCQTGIFTKARVYPDIKWTFSFGYGLPPIKGTEGYVEKEDERDEELGIAQSFAAAHSLSLLAKWTGEKEEQEMDLVKEGAKSIDQGLEKLGMAYKIFEKVLGQSPEPSKKEKKKLEKKKDEVAAWQGRSVSSFKIGAPSITFHVDWKLVQEEAVEKRIYTNYSVNATLDPLIAVQGKLDFIALATKIPSVGLLILALDLAARAATVQFEFYLQADAKAVLSLKAVSLDAYPNDEKTFRFDKTCITQENELSLSLVLGVKVGGTIKGATVRAAASATATVGINPKFEFGYDTDGLYTEFGADFSGIVVTAKVEAEVKLWKIDWEKEKEKEFKLLKEKEDIIDKRKVWFQKQSISESNE